MSYIYDAIIESNQIEDEQILSDMKAEKNPPTLKRRLHMDEECKEDKIEEECKPEDKEETLSEEFEDKEELDEEKLTEEKMIDIEQYLGPENYVESLDTKSDGKLDESLSDKTITETIDLPNRPQKGRPGSPEYDANDNRRKRVARYRKNANIDESFEITNENINDWALTRTCTQYNCSKDRLKAELLKQPYTGLERYDED